MRVAVIGTGNIGGTIGRALARAGHDVTFGARSPGTDDPAQDTGARVTTVEEALQGADAVLVAIPGGAVAGFAEQHADALAATLVVDCANNIGGGGPANSRAAIAAAVPTARYARAFNTLGVENLADPQFGNERADMFFSSAPGDQDTVGELIEAVGLRPVWVGDGSEDVVDGVLRLWFALAQKRGRHLAFRVLDRSDGPA